ncbi:MAG: isochorismatase family protein, partial [Serratia marcescens]|nr:isochorismatase family protein [Serratia marcescens]
MSAALIIIDLIEDLIGPKGRANHCREQVMTTHLLANVNAAAAYARVRKIPVIWVRVGFADDYHDIPPHSPLFNHLKQIGALRLNGPGCRWMP